MQAGSDLHIGNFIYRLRERRRTISVADYGSYQHRGRRLTLEQRVMETSALLNDLSRLLNNFHQLIPDLPLIQLKPAHLDRILEMVLKTHRRKQKRSVIIREVLLELNQAPDVIEDVIAKWSSVKPEQKQKMAAWGMIIGIMFVIILLMVMMGTRKRVAIQANFELLKWPQRPEGSEEPFSWRDADVKSSGDAYRTISANHDSVRAPRRREGVSKI